MHTCTDDDVLVCFPKFTSNITSEFSFLFQSCLFSSLLLFPKKFYDCFYVYYYCKNTKLSHIVYRIKQLLTIVYEFANAQKNLFLPLVRIVPDCLLFKLQLSQYLLQVQSKIIQQNKILIRIDFPSFSCYGKTNLFASSSSIKLEKEFEY